MQRYPLAGFILTHQGRTQCVVIEKLVLESVVALRADKSVKFAGELSVFDLSPALVDCRVSVKVEIVDLCGVRIPAVQGLCWELVFGTLSNHSHGANSLTLYAPLILELG